MNCEAAEPAVVPLLLRSFRRLPGRRGQGEGQRFLLSETSRLSYALIQCFVQIRQGSSPRDGVGPRCTAEATTIRFDFCSPQTAGNDSLVRFRKKIAGLCTTEAGEGGFSWFESDFAANCRRAAVAHALLRWRLTKGRAVGVDRRVESLGAVGESLCFVTADRWCWAVGESTSYRLRVPPWCSREIRTLCVEVRTTTEGHNQYAPAVFANPFCFDHHQVRAWGLLG